VPAVDLDTLTLLLGMMIVVANLRLSGFFTQASGWVMRRAHYPLALLAAVTAVAGVFSAFLVNDAICLWRDNLDENGAAIRMRSGGRDKSWSRRTRTDASPL